MKEARESVLVLVDVQARLWQVMHEKDALLESLRRLTAGAKMLGIPVVWVEQIPDKMGPTVDGLAELLRVDGAPVAKSSFSCWGEPRFRADLGRLGRRHVLLAGIESHVCVYQTAVDLLGAGYSVDVAADAVSSRTAANRAIGLERIRSCGGWIGSVELILFGMLRTAEHPQFRDILRLVK